MRIKEIVIGKLDIPLKRPFRTALRVVNTIEDVVVQIKTDCGRTGYGSASPSSKMSGETTDSIIGALASFIAPRIVGKSISDFNMLLLSINDALPGNFAAKCAMDVALHDLFAQQLEVPLYRLLGASSGNVRTSVSIGLDTTGAMVEQVKAYFSEGFRSFKVKTGSPSGVETDLRNIEEVRRAIGDDCYLGIDANQAWSAKEAWNVATRIEKADLGVKMMEQPVKAADRDGLGFVRGKTTIDIFADEACFSLNDAVDIISNRLADGVVIKLMKSGGLKNSMAIYDVCASRNAACIAGSMMESPIGLAAMASLSAGRPMPYVELDAFFMIKENPVIGGARAFGPEIVLPDRPGLGIEGINCYSASHVVC